MDALGLERMTDYLFWPRCSDSYLFFLTQAYKRADETAEEREP
jgi:hypothetical protein